MTRAQVNDQAVLGFSQVHFDRFKQTLKFATDVLSFTKELKAIEHKFCRCSFY